MSRHVTLGLLLLTGGLVLVLLVVFFLETLVRTGVERIGSANAKVAITVQHVRLSLVGGRAVLEGLAVANPPHFHTPTAVTIRSIAARLAWRTVASDRIVMPEVVIEGPEISFEGSLSDNNLETIRKNLIGAGKHGPSPPSHASKQSKAIVIQRLRIVGARVNVWLRTGTMETKVQGIRLKDITLENLGDPDHPLSAGDVAARVFDAMAQEAIGTIGKTTGGLLGKGADTLSSGTQEAGKTVERAVEGLKQLFSK